MNTFFATLAIAAAATSTPSLSAAADPANSVARVAGAGANCAASQAMTGVQRRIVEKASQGVDSLRGFIFITRGIYNLDMMETVAWLDSERASQSACVALASSATR